MSSGRQTCFCCDKWFTAKEKTDYFCDSCNEEFKSAKVHLSLINGGKCCYGDYHYCSGDTTAMNSAVRMTKIREKLREAEKGGNLGVIAAKANFPEHALYAWLRNPVHSPSRGELTQIERALGLLPDESPQTGDAAAAV